MNVRQLGSAELVVHIFAPAEGPDAVHCYGALRTLWDSVRRQFGLDEVPFPGIGGELPATLDAVRPGVVAARVGDHRDQLSQVLFRWSHDVLILSAVLAPRVVTADPWTELQRQWDAIAPVSATYYGVVKIFQGLLSTGLAPHAELGILARSLAPLVPDARTEPPWLDQGGVAGGGLAVWETGSAADERRERHLLVIGPPGNDDLLSAWTWSTADAATTPLTRYLMHAAKIRYEYRAWAQDSENVRARRVRVSEHSRLVLQQLTTLGSPSLDQEAVSRLLEPFYALELEVAVLVDITGQLQQLRRTVEVALANISEYAEPSWGQPAMFSEDRRLGTRLVAQISDDVTYLAAVKDGARNAIATAREALERRATFLKQEQQEHQDRVSLLQAVVISGVVLCLTVVQALGYQVPLRGGVKPAAVAALCAGSVWLVVFVIRLAALPYLTASRRRTRWRVGEALAAGMASSAVGWALSSWIRLQLLHYRPSGAFTLTWTGLGLVTGAAVSWLAFSVRPRR